MSRTFASGSQKEPPNRKSESRHGRTDPAWQSRSSSPAQSSPSRHSQPEKPPRDWDENPDLSISAFSELPSLNFGVNQHMVINAEFKEALRQILWQFRAPIRYAFAYGSGVFPQTAQAPTSPSSTVHPKTSEAISTVQGTEGKMIDFIFGVSYSQHWHSLNLHQHRDHYSGVGSLGSYVVSKVQDNWGAGVYFNPYVTVNGTLIKYGVVNLDTLCTDLSEWSTLYIAGRLQKPVKILRDDPRVRLANQVNLISAVRTALLLLPEEFSEHDLYSTIAGISYLGDPRMALPTENPKKVQNIVTHQIANFRRLYAPLVDNLPNIAFTDPITSARGWEDDPSANARLVQDMDPIKRGNMVRRLPKAFRGKLYFAFQSRYQIPRADFNRMLEQSKDEDAKGIKRQVGGTFEQRVASESPLALRRDVSGAIKKTIAWPSFSQSAKGLVTSGLGRTWRYMSAKNQKFREGRRKEVNEAKLNKEQGEKKERGRGELNTWPGKRD